MTKTQRKRRKYPRFREGVRCVVCGAKIYIDRYGALTCDPVCTRARNNGITREEQFWRDAKWEEICKANDIPIFYK